MPITKKRLSRKVLTFQDENNFILDRPREEPDPFLGYIRPELEDMPSAIPVITGAGGLQGPPTDTMISMPTGGSSAGGDTITLSPTPPILSDEEMTTTLPTTTTNATTQPVGIQVPVIPVIPLSTLPSPLLPGLKTASGGAAGGGGGAASKESSASSTSEKAKFPWWILVVVGGIAVVAFTGKKKTA